MEYLYMVREYLKGFYTKFDIYIVSLAKFLFTFFMLKNINTELGFMDKLNNSVVVLVAALVCMLMPWGVSVFIAALFVLAHCYALSLELAGVVLVVFIIMFCMYLRFGTGDAVYILITLLLMFMNMPYTIPVFVGLTAPTVTTLVPVAFGIIMYYFIGFAASNTDVLGVTGTEGMLDRFKFIIDNALADRMMILMIVAFAVTIILVYTIRKLAIDYAWLIAVIFGTIVNIIIMLLGNAMMEVEISTASLALGSIIAVVLMIILQMFIFAVDYRSKVRVQFEDDDYVYYVKAVPKVKYALDKEKKNTASEKAKKPVKTVKRKPVTSGRKPKPPVAGRTAKGPASKPTGSRPNAENTHDNTASHGQEEN